MNHEQQVSDFKEMLKSFSNAMLTTVNGDGLLRARPMLIATVTDNTDVIFVTRIDSGKVDEITEHTEVGVTCQDGNRFLSLSGRAVIVNDKEKINQLYDDAWAAWFPEGRDDPAIRLIRVSSVRGESWRTGNWQASSFALGLSQTLTPFASDQPEAEKAKVKLG